MMHRLAPAAFALAALCACASTPDAPPRSPDYSAIATRPPSSRTRLYADCVAASVAAGTYAQVEDADTDMIQFRCDGPPARAFYQGLSAHSAAVGSEFVHAGRTYRSTNRVLRDLFGVDWCSTAGGVDFDCAISLNAGHFLRESAD